MKWLKTWLMASAALLLVSSAAMAADFDWLRDFNIQAEADPSGFRARLEARFKIGDVQIRTVLGNVEKPADAYMVLRLGEMSNRPVQEVVDRYQAGKGKGWGALAKSLGIKPGSKAFKALKRSHDLKSGSTGKPTKAKGKGRGKKKK